MTQIPAAAKGLTLPEIRDLWNDVNRRLLTGEDVDNYLEFARLSPDSRRMITALALEAHEMGVQSARRLDDAARTAMYVAEDDAAKHGRCLHCGGRLPDDGEAADVSR